MLSRLVAVRLVEIFFFECESGDSRAELADLEVTYYNVLIEERCLCDIAVASQGEYQAANKIHGLHANSEWSARTHAIRGSQIDHGHVYSNVWFDP